MSNSKAKRKFVRNDQVQRCTSFATETKVCYSINYQYERFSRFFLNIFFLFVDRAYFYS